MLRSRTTPSRRSNRPAASSTSIWAASLIPEATRVPTMWRQRHRIPVLCGGMSGRSGRPHNIALSTLPISCCRATSRQQTLLSRDIIAPRCRGLGSRTSPRQPAGRIRLRNRSRISQVITVAEDVALDRFPQPLRSNRNYRFNVVGPGGHEIRRLIQRTSAVCILPLANTGSGLVWAGILDRCARFGNDWPFPRGVLLRSPDRKALMIRNDLFSRVVAFAFILAIPRSAHAVCAVGGLLMFRVRRFFTSGRASISCRLSTRGGKCTLPIRGHS